MLPHWPVFNVADMLHQRRRRADPASRPSAASGIDGAAPPTATSRPESTVTARRPPGPRRCPTAWPASGVDAAMARMFGLSRTRAADLIADGPRRRSTAPRVGKSDRVLPGAMLDVTIPVDGRPARGRARDRRGHQDHPRRRLDRGDRQAGRRRRPPLARLVRPDRGRPPRRRRVPDRHQRRLGAAGHRAAPRRRHLGRDGDLQVRARLLGAQERVPPPRRSTRPTTRWSRATPTRSRAPSTPRSAGTRRRTTSSR